jgi:hypothetical protein
VRATAPGQSALLLLDVVTLLRACGGEYLVVGAMAVAVHGVVRASLDADEVAFAAVTQARELASGCQAAGLVAQLRVGDHDDPIGALLAVEDAHSNRVDVLFGLRGLDRSALTRAVSVPFEGVSL